MIATFTARSVQFFTRLSLLCLIALQPAVAAAQGTSDWPQFLGPARNGISSETGLLDRWPEGGPKEVWRADGGVGMSGLAISRGRLITLIQKDGKQWLSALNAQTGQQQWQTEIAQEYKNQQGDGPRATPTIAGDLVIALSGQGVLTAVGLGDGKQSGRETSSLSWAARSLTTAWPVRRLSSATW
jgi:hypothetical protein